MEHRDRSRGIAERWLTKPHSPGPEMEGHGGDPDSDETGMVHGPIDFEQELEHARCLLEEVRDEAMAVSEQVQAVDACL